jgi:hypothetical protein
LWNQCMNAVECVSLWQCIAVCADDVFCKDKCAAALPGAVKLYNSVAACVVCDACAIDCAQMGEPCP